MIFSFKERVSGDFLAIDTATNRYYLRTFGEDRFEARATAIEGQVGSLCTCEMSREFLQIHCERIAKRKVPREWQKAIGF